MYTIKNTFEDQIKDSKKGYVVHVTKNKSSNKNSEKTQKK